MGPCSPPVTARRASVCVCVSVRARGVAGGGLAPPRLGSAQPIPIDPRCSAARTDRQTERAGSTEPPEWLQLRNQRASGPGTEEGS